jgi:hypothetical protein
MKLINEEGGRLQHLHPFKFPASGMLLNQKILFPDELLLFKTLHRAAERTRTEVINVNQIAGLRPATCES